MVASSTSNNLEREDHSRDAAFNKALHGKSAQARGGVAAMFSKGASAKQAAVDEYFKHWDNKDAKDETAETRAVSALRPPPTAKRGSADIQPRLALLSMRL